MAKGTIVRGIGAYGKDEKTRKSEAKLAEKLQADLESAILRLFENSAYCDVELIAESDSVLAHSCILQARVARFYNFLITECKVLRKNGLSSIAIYNVSFFSLRSFVENIYKNVEISELEECMLQSLIGRKADLTEQKKLAKTPEASLKKSSSSHSALTPEADLFYTPKCSPSEIQKPFTQSYSDSPIRRKDNDITCYYKIVSVDDIQIDEKADQQSEKVKYDGSSNDDEHLEKELAEQDELFLSFKSIFSKVNKEKPNKHPNTGSYAARKTESPKPARKLQSNALLSDDSKRGRAKLPLWRPNTIVRDSGRIHFDKQNLSKSILRNSTIDHLSLRKKLEFHSGSVPQDAGSHNSDMDVSATGGDSGLETSSSCQPEVSPRENTVSETSGVDLTEAAINEEIPHDEETVSTKLAGSINSSSSSDVGTWDANDDTRAGYNDKEYGTSVMSDGGFEGNNKSTYNEKEGSCFCRDTLNEEEIARLDAMEKNIRDCETFLDRERQIFYCFDNTPVVGSEEKESVKKTLNSDETISVLESAKDVILQNKLFFSGDKEMEEIENNNLAGGNAISEDNYLYDKQLSNVTNTVSDNCTNLDNFDGGNDLDSHVICKNLINNDHVGRSYSVFERDNSRECYNADEAFTNNLSTLTQQGCDSGVYNINSSEILNVKTPPCSPRHVYKLSQSERKSDMIFPDTKSNCQSSIIPSVNNYFIDASSLLDDDEIISPPVSLLGFKTSDKDECKKEENEETSKCDDDDGVLDDQVFEKVEDDKMINLQEEERRQGDLIFKNSIPHFSRHEVEKVDEAMERLRGGTDLTEDLYNDDNEQVVPSADVQADGSFSPAEPNPVDFVGTNEDYGNASPCEASPSDIKTPTEDEVKCGESTPKADSADGIAKRMDAESLPIVSGGALPEDFSNSSSHISSPHLRRRNESAPILSGGMEYVEEEKKPERKPNVSQGAAWIVSFSDEKPRRRRHTGTTTTSESDLESLEINGDLDNEPPKETGSELKEVNLYNTQYVSISDLNNAKEITNDEKPSQRTSNPIEKSASLGYFIEFSKEDQNAVEEQGESNKTKQSAKKNIFSMFIDMKDDPKMAETVPSFERQNTYDKDTEVQEEVVKKPFYMFIESDSPAVKRKANPQLGQRKMIRSFDSNNDDGQEAGQMRSLELRRRTDGGISPMSKASVRESSLPPPELNAENDQKVVQPPPRHSKLPLPLCKSSSLSSVNADARMVVWAEKKEPKNDSLLSDETWVRTNDIQVTYKGRRESARDGSSDSEESLKKSSVFLIPEETAGMYRKRENRKSSDGRGGFHLKTLEEGRSPFKSPEERDSGVIVTEESDDSFVKLSDMDNFKNPYLDDGKKKAGGDAMSQSIPESSWIESKAFPRGGDNGESLMSKSIGTGLVKSSSGTAFASDKNVSRSLSRLFPNLNLSNSFARKSASSVSSAGKIDTDPSDTQVSEVSEISSMQSSIEPSGLETSTSETDVSCHNGTSKLGEDLLRMFLEEISPDVIVEVGGRRMKAHKCILSSRCQYFAAMLSGGWVESAGNVISLQGFSYNSVHFALCHIYSGENRIPDSLNIIELATLADMLCLEGLKEVISHTLKVKYCHCFHLPCDECHVGVLDCLPVAAAYGLDDLYRKCLRWITKHFVRVWPSKTFASLPRELLDKCYQHHVVHMTVENVLDTILNIDTVRGSLPNVRWSETISRLVSKLHDAAVKYIADHFSSILTSDNFLALGKEAGWSVGRLEDSLMKATKRLPPEQACWSHARLHRILTVAKGPDPPSEMDWNGNFIDLLQCISGHVENSLIKQAPRAAKSKAWRQMEPELRSRIQERACLVLPDDVQSPKPKRTTSLKRESRQISTSSSAPRSSSRNLEIRHMKLAMTQQVNRTSSLGRLQHTDQRTMVKESRPLKPVAVTAATRKTETGPGSARKPATGGPEIKKVTPSRFMDVKSRYLEPKSPQKTLTDKPSNMSSIRKTTRPLSSSDSSRNCSPLNANTHGRVGAIPSARQHRDSVVSTESATSYDGKKDRSCISARSDTPSTKTLSRLTADDNMSTDSLYTDSLYSEKDATSKKSDESKSKGKENMRKGTTKPIGNSGVLVKPANYSSGAKKLNSENSTSSSSMYRTSASKKLTAPGSETKATPPKRFPAARIANVNQKASPGRASLASPRNSTNRNMLQKTATRYDANVINGNTVKKKRDVDSENNRNSAADDTRPSTVSRSGTFLKDEPTILKKPQPENIESSF